jgi:phosphopantothenoylcysteine decarboxylase/phosphopantothenate--cysteine ligase
MNLGGKNVLVGITASIAAYKTASLVRLLVQSGAHVKVVMTPDSLHFIGALTLSTLSKNPVYSQYYDEKTGEWSNHVELGKWADLFIIAPATANTIAKMANGLCDNLLLATYLSSDCPVFIAPAMDLDMYQHPSFTENVNRLKKFGNHIIDSTSGELASGLTGAGRMEEPEEIVTQLLQFKFSGQLSGKKIIISAGPTYEAIDPVRFIGNHSSGKMGYALAEEAHKKGAEVILVSGPTAIEAPKGVQLIKVTSAIEMYDAVHAHIEKMDIAIMAAAVADYRPSAPADEKIKKKGDSIQFEMIPNPDILKSIGQNKKAHQTIVGFALETENELENAQAKLVKKNLDLIVLNSLKDKGAGFGGDTNQVKLIEPNNKVTSIQLKSKQEIASDIISKIIEIID